MEIFERFNATGEKITGKTIFEEYPIGRWTIQIRNMINRKESKKSCIKEINLTKEQLKRLEEMGIIERQIESTIDEKIDALIQWGEKYPKANIIHASSKSTLKEYAKTDEEYKKLLKEYEKMQKYYEYVKSRKRKNKLSKEQEAKGKEGNIRGIFGYPTKVEKLAQKYGVTEKNIDYILINYGTIENFYKLFINQELKNENDITLAGSMIKSVLDLDFYYNKGKYDKLYKAIIGKKDTDPELKLYFSKKLEEKLQNLKERERYIIERVFGLTEENLPTTYTDIGITIVLTSTRIKAIETNTLSILRKKIERYDFDEQKIRETLTKNEIKEISGLEEKLDRIRLLNMNDDETIKFLRILKSFVYEPGKATKQQICEKLTEEKNQELDKSPKLEELGFSSRIKTVLERNNIKTLKQISKKTSRELSEIRWLGKKSIEEIISKLEEYGLNLREENNTKTKSQKINVNL